MTTWTDDDFRTVFAFLRDMKAMLDEPGMLADPDVRALLQSECAEASRRLSRIVDAVCASV